MKTYDPKEVIKEDAMKRAGRVDNTYPLTIKSAQLAIDDCKDDYEEANESLEEKVQEAVTGEEGKGK